MLTPVPLIIEPGTRIRFRDRYDTFLAKKPDPVACWEWMGSRSPEGYGHVRHDGRFRDVHAVAYELSIGPIPKPLELDHVCRNPPCFNATHLEAVTRAENMRRRSVAQTHCWRGHEFTSENTILIPRSDGLPGVCRWCRECGRIRSREYRRKNNGTQDT